jgi:hypothetical protein
MTTLYFNHHPPFKGLIIIHFPINYGLIKFGILFLDAKFAKNKNSKLPKLSGCLYVWVYDLAASGYWIAASIADPSAHSSSSF